jgi:hypothetical protein
MQEWDELRCESSDNRTEKVGNGNCVALADQTNSLQPFQMSLRGLSRWRKFMHPSRFVTTGEFLSINGRRTVTSSTPRSIKGTDEHHAYCRNLVQRHDYEAYLVSQLYPIDKRDGYFAIKAFYVCLQ